MSLLNHKFPDVPEDGKICTMEFLDSCDCIVEFFNCLESKAFIPVKNDITGNINKIRGRLLEQPDKFGTLTDLIDTELGETDKKLKQGTQGRATNALMWLRRGLFFISRFFVHLLEKDYATEKKSVEYLQNCALKAYEESLKVYHGFFVGKIFSLAMVAAPYRSKLLQNIAGRTDNNEDEKTLEAIREFNVNFSKNIEHITKLFHEKRVEVEGKV